MSIKTWTNGSGGNTYGVTLANGVYDNGMYLTSVGSLSGLETYGPQVDIYGIDNEDLSSNNQNTVWYPYVSLFWGRWQQTMLLQQSYTQKTMQIKSYLLILKDSFFQIKITTTIIKCCSCYFNFRKY